MTELQIIYVKDCIKAKDMPRFYIWSEWLKVRKRVLDLDKDECQDCKAKGIYTKATTVHHINHVKNRPDLALEIYTNDGDTRRRNLVSLCHDCHEIRHGRKYSDRTALTAERW